MFSLTVTVGECPIDTLFLFGCEGKNDAVGTGLRRVHPDGGEHALGFEVEFDFLACFIQDLEFKSDIILGSAEPKGIFIAFEHLMPDHEFLAAFDFSVPVVFPDNEALFDKRYSGFHGEAVRIVNGGMAERGAEEKHEAREEGSHAMKERSGGKGHEVSRVRVGDWRPKLPCCLDICQEAIAGFTDLADAVFREAVHSAFHFGEDQFETFRDVRDIRMFFFVLGHLAD